MRQHERRAATIAALVHEGSLAFARQGYANASVDAIASAAGYSKGALYANFKTKQELFLAVVRELLEGSRERVDRVATALEGGAGPQAAARVYFDGDDSDTHAQLMTETWRIAVQDPEILDALESFRRDRLNRVALALEAAHLKPAATLDRANLVCRMIDALTVERLLGRATGT